LLEGVAYFLFGAQVDDGPGMAVWYSGAMIQRWLGTLAVVLVLAQAHAADSAQAGHGSGAQSKPASAASVAAAPGQNPSSAAGTGSPLKMASAQDAAPGSQPAAASQGAPAPAAGPGGAAGANGPNSANRTDCYGGSCDFQPPHIAISTPAPAPAPWPWQERIAWGANIVLVALGYAAILIALSLLRKIERQTRYGEAAAQAAAESAQAALAHVQAVVRAERPWIMVHVRPSQSAENSFGIVATNRGRGPARIVSTVDEIVSAVDESRLAATPVYKNEPVAPADPVILLPGETTEILSFSRADVKGICETEERMNRVEKWEEKIYLYGKIVYRDLAAPDNAPAHESSWFCWYIHGRQKSGMVMTGPAAYNRHT